MLREKQTKEVLNNLRIEKVLRIETKCARKKESKKEISEV